MASQQVLFAETIAGMKKAFKRKVYESDSDSEIENYSNRGHKLKRRARFAHKGQLVPAGGPSPYKEVIDYAGVRRSILTRNPPLIDDEGYEVDSEDGDDRVEDAIAAAAELNPYANIRLEHILAPLTASTNLPTHPTLSKPFTSKTLTDLVSQSCTIMRKENQSLWQVRHMLTALCGDGVWMPCESMVGSNDAELYTEDMVARHLQSLANDRDAASSPTVNGETANDSSKAVPNGEIADVSMTDIAAATSGDHERSQASKTGDSKDDTDKAEGADKSSRSNNKSDAGKKSNDSDKGETGSKPDTDMALDTDAINRALAKGDTNGNPNPLAASEALEESFIHPMFLPPSDARPDRNLGLPEHEADDMRKLLALYVQKQEEVCRGARKLHHGLLRAERLRADVLHWAKAEAHSGPNRDLSDGEDWYDKEEWGLTEDLKKGQDEEEEDVTTTGKKTRARR